MRGGIFKWGLNHLIEEGDFLSQLIGSLIFDSSRLFRRARRELHGGGGQQRHRRVRRRGRQSDYRDARSNEDGMARTR